MSLESRFHIPVLLQGLPDEVQESFNKLSAPKILHDFPVLLYDYGILPNAITLAKPSIIGLDDPDTMWFVIPIDHGKIIIHSEAVKILNNFKPIETEQGNGLEIFDIDADKA